MTLYFDSPEIKNELETNKTKDLNPFAFLNEEYEQMPRFIMSVINEEFDYFTEEVRESINQRINKYLNKYRNILNVQGISDLSLHIIVKVVNNVDLREHSKLVELVRGYLYSEIEKNNVNNSQELLLLSNIVNDNFLLDTKNILNLTTFTSIINNRILQLFTLISSVSPKITLDQLRCTVDHILFLKFYVLPNFIDRESD